MQLLRDRIEENAAELSYTAIRRSLHPPGKAQMIIGATPESDYDILRLTERLYQQYRLKRVFSPHTFPSQSMPCCHPCCKSKPPLLREHRLYQADWLLRFYGFELRNYWTRRTAIFIPCWIEMQLGAEPPGIFFR